MIVFISQRATLIIGIKRFIFLLSRAGYIAKKQPGSL